MNGLDIVSVESSCGDWYWLYVDGKKTNYEGHRLEPEDMAKAVNDYIKENSKGSYLHHICGINFASYSVNDNYAEEGNLPMNLKDIPEDVFE